MKLRNVLGAAVGTVGATALANRVLRSRAEEFDPFLAGDQGTYRWRGFDVTYAELGDPADEDMLLFHGISAASSNHEFHRVVERLADEYHVIAPDLHGFGHSDRPPLLYSASLYATFVEDAIEDLSDEAPIVVASSLTGAHAAAAARGADVSSLVLICPTDSSLGGRQVWLRALFRSPVIGEGLFNLLASKASIRYFNADHGYADPANITDEVVDYEWLTAHQPGARFAPASFVSGFLDPDEPLEETLGDVDAPVLLVWGRDSDITPLDRGREVAERADTGLVVFDRAKLLPHVEHPEQFVDVISEEVAVMQ
ncbi:alpha/beta hydrolase [Halobacteriales archaeon SW_7_65_23]|nr:MAG: alpha/beta hydrolase [Halobacteriales archaeon SW_7_65_23]